ncbi:MAG TPA: hypothetical protein VH351_05700 [Bryobacteraceae bacterium]|jgi:hypothetical protein|nr:hypothetical protein [Bryobacteraceae bacterium]
MQDTRPNNMNNYLEHPGEEVLERFVLHQSGEEELEVVETHILACDSCVARLENLEIDIAATKLALQEIKRKEALQSQVAAARRASWRSWFTMPRLSMAGGLAAIALGILIVPQFRTNDTAAEVNLYANRGQEVAQAPLAKPLHVVLNNLDLPDGSVVVKLLDDQGKEDWTAVAPVQKDQVALNLPKIQQRGEYHIQLYGTGSNTANELKEFAFEVK